MFTLVPIPNRTLTVLRAEANAAREGTLVVDGVDIDMAELLEDAADEIKRLRDEVERLHAVIDSRPGDGAREGSW